MLYYALNKYQIPEGYTFNSYINEIGRASCRERV